jgi:Na+/phosphate symporter
MTEKALKLDFAHQLHALCPIVDTLRLMFGAARHAFNRSSKAELEELAKLQDTFTLDIDVFFEDVEKGLEKAGASDKPALLRLQGILTHLEIVGANISAMSDPIRRKIKFGATFADVDFYYLNNLFTQHTGFMRGLVDVFKHDDSMLRSYLLHESQKIIEQCYRAGVDHETRMVDGFGQPEAWSIYLSILDHTRIILRHVMDIVKALG